MPKGRSKSSARSNSDSDQITKEEKRIATYLYHNVQSKKATMYGNEARYFSGYKIVNTLAESHWFSAEDKNLSDALFSSRRQCIDYCDELLSKNVFHRVTRHVKRLKPRKSKTTSDDDEEKKSDDAKLRKKTKKLDATKTAENETQQKKKKLSTRKVLLELHPDQVLCDEDSEYYVWVFEPTSVWRWLVGFALILATISICLFPLWPETMRTVVWYITSYSLMILLGSLIILAIVRLLIYMFVFAISGGSKRFWLLPNLFEDVGFFDSFKPLYSCIIVKSSSSKKEKISDDDSPQSDRENISKNNPLNSEDDYEIVDDSVTALNS